MKKKILALGLASSLFYSCNNSLEDRKKDLEEKLSEIYGIISENPNDYKDIIDKISSDAYMLKLETVKELPVKKGYIDPKDFVYVLNKAEDEIYISLYNKKTKESHNLVYVENTTQLGDFNHRFYGLKQESGKIIYEKTKGIGKGFGALAERWNEVWFLLGNMF